MRRSSTGGGLRQRYQAVVCSRQLPYRNLAKNGGLVYVTYLPLLPLLKMPLLLVAPADAAQDCAGAFAGQERPRRRRAWRPGCVPTRAAVALHPLPACMCLHPSAASLHAYPRPCAVAAHSPAQLSPPPCAMRTHSATAAWSKQQLAAAGGVCYTEASRPHLTLNPPSSVP